MKYIGLIVILLLCIVNSKLKVDPSTSLFIDENGRYRIYHGVNVIYKVVKKLILIYCKIY